jgi:hydrogenase maturation protease
VTDAQPAGSVLVVGIGSPLRADDALGPAVIGLVAEELALLALGARSAGGRRRRAALAPAHLLVLGDPMRLVDELEGCRLLVVVDAMLAGERPAAPQAVAAPVGQLEPGGLGERASAAGTVVVLTTGAGRPPLPVQPDDPTRGTHGFGLPAALELSRVLGRLPERVVVVGVLAEQLEDGAAMSPAVRAAIPDAAAEVLAVLRAEGAAHALHPGDPPPWTPHPSG